MRNDTHTRTPDAAAAFERANGAPWYDSRTPSAAELAEDAYLDRLEADRRRRREDAARARGDYVPTPGMALQASRIAWTLAAGGQPDVEVVPVRHGVFRLDRAVAPVPSLPEDHEVAVRDGVVWVRVPDLEDPFSNAHNDNPPF